MNRVAGVAGFSAGVIRFNYLREASRTSGALFVTPQAGGSDIRFSNVGGLRVFDVYGSRAVTDLAGDIAMRSGGVFGGFVLMAVGARRLGDVAGVVGHCGGQGFAAIVSVLTEAVGLQPPARRNKGEHDCGEDIDETRDLWGHRGSNARVWRISRDGGGGRASYL